jgi:CxxC motif-containing protein (DUF1111 family)
MKPSQLTVVVCAAMALAIPDALSQTAPPSTAAIPDAPAAFDGETNGFLTPAEFEEAKEVFEEREFDNGEDGLGPVFNAQACVECHQSPVSGGSSQVSELRAGRFDARRGVFVEHPGGSLINDRAIDAAFQETVQPGNDVRAFRMSLNTLGDGFVEAIDSNTLAAIARDQPPSMRGQLVQVPVLEAGGALRTGRFGWKCQHASLESFSADAYLNEMGITTPLQPTDNASNGRTTTRDGRPITDGVADPEDDGADVVLFANFMRSTKAPPRDAALAATPAARAGELHFAAVGCAVCHVASIVTAPAGTRINGGRFVVPAALGGKRIRPFSDFLMHDVGTGDGIVQNGGPGTRNKLRTTPLWGLRTRGRLMHDGLSLHPNEAILRHAGEAAFVTLRYRGLSDQQREQLLAFLASL